jgi:hypothetical protein
MFLVGVPIDLIGTPMFLVGVPIDLAGVPMFLVGSLLFGVIHKNFV